MHLHKGLYMNIHSRFIMIAKTLKEKKNTTADVYKQEKNREICPSDESLQSSIELLGEGERVREGPPPRRRGSLACAPHCGCAGRARQGGGDAEGAAGCGVRREAAEGRGRPTAWEAAATRGPKGGDAMLETLRERLLSVQQDFTSGLKTLSDKSREAKVKSKPRAAPNLSKYSAGLELLSRYEDIWAALHRRAKECADAGELVDSEVVMLSAHWEKKRTSLSELQEQLQQLPALLQDLESLMASLAHLETSFEEIENHLLRLEDLCGQCELERHKLAQSQHLENYKKSKRKELEAFKELKFVTED
nr:dysbindin [Meriones unguiculatus]